MFNKSLVLELRNRISYLENQLAGSERERKLLLERLLERQGERPLGTSVPVDQPQAHSELPVNHLLKQDILAELAELAEAAQSNPEVFGPLYEEAVIAYRNQFDE